MPVGAPFCCWWTIDDTWAEHCVGALPKLPVVDDLEDASEELAERIAGAAGRDRHAEHQRQDGECGLSGRAVARARRRRRVGLRRTQLLQDLLGDASAPGDLLEEILVIGRHRRQILRNERLQRLLGEVQQIRGLVLLVLHLAHLHPICPCHRKGGVGS